MAQAAQLQQQSLLLLAQLTVCACGSSGTASSGLAPPHPVSRLPGLPDDAAGFAGLGRDVAALRDLVRQLRTSTALSLYQVALAGGLEAYLHGFVGAVAALEADFLADPAVTPHHARYGLKPYFAAVPVLLRLTQEVVEKNALGGAVLDALHAAAGCGDGDVRAACEALLAHVRRPFLAQIAHWLAFATLDVGSSSSSDDSRSSSRGGGWDFFVTPPKASRAAGGGGGPGSLSASSARHSSSSNSSGALLESGTWAPSTVEQFYAIAASVGDEEEEEGGELTSREEEGGGRGASAAVFPAHPSASEATSLRGPLIPAAEPVLGAGVQDAAGRVAHAACLADAAVGDARASFERSRVPVSHLSYELAYSIYSVGSAVALLAAPAPGSSSSSSSSGGAEGAWGRAPQASDLDAADLADFDGSDDGEDDELGEPAAAAGWGGGSVAPWRFGPKESLFVTRLFSSLRSGGSAAGAYSPLALQCVVDRVKGLVHKRLWRLLVEGAGLDAHLASLRSYCLMGRADLFQAFLERLPGVTGSMPATSSSTLNQIAAGPWAAAAVSTGIQGEGDRADTRLAALVERLGALAPDDDDEEEEEEGEQDEEEENGFGGSRYGGIEEEHGFSRDRDGAAGSPRRGGDERRGGQRGNGGRSGGGGDPTFRLVRWVLRQKALRWEAPEPVALKPAGAVAAAAAPSRAPLAALGAAAAGAGSAAVTTAVLKHWAPVGEGADAANAAGLLRHPRAQATLALAGTASPLALPVLRMQPAPAPTIEQLLYVSGAPAAGSTAPTRLAHAGAAWLSQPPVVTKGFLLRACLALDVPSSLPPPPHDLVLAGVYEPHTAAVAVQLAQTTSFALVVQRAASGSAAVGRDTDPLPRPAGTAAAAAAGARHSDTDDFGLWRPAPSGTSAPPPPRVSSVPTAGYDGLEDALVAHVMCRRNGGEARDGYESVRLVVAVYGPPAPAQEASAGAAGTRADGRKLLASGVVPDLQLPVTSRYRAADGSDRCLMGLSLALEYTGNNSAAGGAKESRLRVSVLDVPPGSAAPAARRDSTASSVVTTASGGGAAAALLAGAQTRSLIDTPLALPTVLNLVAAWKGPGRDRALLGVTADTGSPLLQAGASRGALRPSGVALTALDAISYSEADEGFAGLSLTYAPPPPLALVLPRSALAAYQDVFSLLFTTRAAAFKLQRSWVELMSSFSTDTRGSGPGAAALTAAAGGGGGAGGKAGAGAAAGRRGALSRSRGGAGAATAGDDASAEGAAALLRGKWNPAVASTRRSRIAVHTLLKPVWALRHRMAAVADALVYYLQVDVIEAAYAAMAVAAGFVPAPGGAAGASAASSGARSFSSLHAAHTAFLARVLAGAFFTNSVLLGCIHRILGHCTRFADFVTTYASGGGSGNGGTGGVGKGAAKLGAGLGRGGGAAAGPQSVAASLPALLHPEQGRPVFLEISTGFESDMRLLVGALASVAGAAGGDGLAADTAGTPAAAPQSLLLRLNFNGFFAGL